MTAASIKICWTSENAETPQSRYIYGKKCSYRQDVGQEDYEDGNDNDYGHGNHPEVIVKRVLQDVGHLPVGPPFAHL